MKNALALNESHTRQHTITSDEPWFLRKSLNVLKSQNPLRASSIQPLEPHQLQLRASLQDADLLQHLTPLVPSGFSNKKETAVES